MLPTPHNLISTAPLNDNLEQYHSQDPLYPSVDALQKADHIEESDKEAVVASCSLIAA